MRSQTSPKPKPQPWGTRQNAQSSTKQTRSYTYDDLGRVLTETNPETGSTATTYTYDTDSTCGTSDGDLVKKVDQTDTICYSYDALHRLTSVIYPAGGYSSTPRRYFVYDAATVNSVAMANAKARMAEAYTCTGSCTSKITDIGLSYTVRGEVSDVYESTPHSGGYNHSSATYWANGVLDTLSGAGGYATNYAVDGEGRVYSAGTSGGELKSTTYNAASQPLIVTFGSGDSDTFSYDPNTGRMNGYTFTVNSQSATGTLTWNPIGTLEKLVIADPFNSANAQTCNYTHDDLSRIASDNCGSSTWSQTFSYDSFGNITKVGNPGSSFQPTYNTSTNQITSIGGCNASYDSNGNVKNDCLNSYAWDANGRPVTVNGVTVTYDALGRAAELTNGSTNTEIQYSPTGFKMQLLNGSTLVKGFVPMPGGTAEVWTGSGANYYRHSDWLGSSRLASNFNRTIYGDVAYGPFGESYAQSGTTDLSFTGMDQDISSNVYDFPAREYGIQGRWPSPDPAGLAAAHPTDPQTWNRYAYVRNSPLNAWDPTGMDCAYLNDRGDDVESIDTDSNAGECGSNGGYWIDGTVSQVAFDPNSNWIGLVGITGTSDNPIYSSWTPVCNGTCGTSSADGLAGLLTLPTDPGFLPQTEDPMSSSSRAAALAIRSQLARIPTVCGKMSLFAAAEVNGFGGYGQMDESGNGSASSLVPLPPWEGNAASTSSGPIFFVGEGAGFVYQPNLANYGLPSAIGVYAGFDIPLTPIGVAVGAEIEDPRVADAYQCTD